MIYIFSGDDQKAKDEELSKLKKKTLPSPEALSFDFDSLDASKLDPRTLNERLLAVAAVAKERFIVVNDAKKLNQAHQDIIIAFSKKNHPAVLVLDYEKLSQKDPFLNEIRRAAKVFNFEKESSNVFDMTDAISRRDQAEALKLLSGLLARGEKPLNIMGGIVWSWKKAKVRIKKEKYLEGLHALQEADLNIKRSRLKPEHALEICVVKLCG